MSGVLMGIFRTSRVYFFCFLVEEDSSRWTNQQSTHASRCIALLLGINPESKGDVVDASDDESHSVYPMAPTPPPPPPITSLPAPLLMVLSLALHDLPHLL